MSREPNRGYALSTGIEVDPREPAYVENRPAYVLSKSEEALEQCDRALASNPRDIDALLRKAALFLGPYLDADMVERMQFVAISGKLNKAGDFVQEGEIDAVERYLATFWMSSTKEHFCGLFTVPDCDPQQSEALFWINGEARGAAALAVLDAAGTIDLANLKVLWWTAFILYRSKRWSEALNCYDRMLELDSDDARTLRAKAACLERLGRYNEAIEYYNRELATKPPGSVSIQKADALVEAGRLDEAVDCYERVLSKTWLKTHAAFMLGYVLTLRGEYDDALEHVSAACQGIISSEALWLRPYLHYMTGNLAAARSELASLKQAYPFRFVESATNLRKIVFDIAYRRLVENIAAAAPA